MGEQVSRRARRKPTGKNLHAARLLVAHASNLAGLSGQASIILVRGACFSRRLRTDDRRSSQRWKSAQKWSDRRKGTHTGWAQLRPLWSSGRGERGTSRALTRAQTGADCQVETRSRYVGQLCPCRLCNGWLARSLARGSEKERANGGQIVCSSARP